MNMIKYVVFRLLLLGIPVIGQGQDVKISMMHIKQNNLLILNLTNNTDKEVVIMNQSSLNELSGSRITIIQNIDGKRFEILFPLFDTEEGKRVPVKTLKPKGKLSVSYYFNKMNLSNVKRAEVQVVVFFKDENTGRMIAKNYYSELNL